MAARSFNYVALDSRANYYILFSQLFSESGTGDVRLDSGCVLSLLLLDYVQRQRQLRQYIDNGENPLFSENRG